MTAAKIREALELACGYLGTAGDVKAFPAQETLRALLDSGFLESSLAYAKIMRRDLRNKPDAEQYGRAIDIARHEFYEAHRALEGKPHT